MHLNPLKAWTESHRNLRRDSAVRRAIEQFGDLSPEGQADCAEVSDAILSELRKQGFLPRSLSIVSRPSGDIGHRDRPNQLEHVVIEEAGRIIDPFLIGERAMPLQCYLKKAYNPKPGITLVPLYH